jgi:hypothetical protein
MLYGRFQVISSSSCLLSLLAVVAMDLVGKFFGSCAPAIYVRLGEAEPRFEHCLCYTFD